MTQDKDTNYISSDSVLGDTVRDICALAEKHRNDSLFLLSLLRDLEKIHRQIRVELFEGALPKTRNDLYQFVKDIEEKRWLAIYRENETQGIVAKYGRIGKKRIERSLIDTR